MGGIVPEFPDFFKLSCHQAGGYLSNLIFSSNIINIGNKLEFHIFRMTIFPPLWLLPLAISTILAVLLFRKPKSWQIIQTLVNRISYMRFPPGLTLLFRDDQPQHPQQPIGNNQKRPRK